MRNWTHHHAVVNGWEMHYVQEGSGPLVVLLHGFPHTWFSWRHQISALAAAGYKVVAPDLRGMGQSSAPQEVADYHAGHIVADICGLLDHLGEDQAVFAGMDFGQFVAYDIAREHPERVRGLIGVQYSFYPHYDRLPSEVEAERGRDSFNHMSYYAQDPQGAQADYEAHTREIIAKIHYALSSNADFAAVAQNPPGTAYRDALPEPPDLPWQWMSEWEMEHYVSDYARSGFRGPVNWYLSADQNWLYRQGSDVKTTSAPFYFLTSAADLQLAEEYGGPMLEQLKLHHTAARAVRSIEGGGYLLALEHPKAVNEVLIWFLKDLDAAPRDLGSRDQASLSSR